MENSANNKILKNHEREKHVLNTLKNNLTYYSVSQKRRKKRRGREKWQFTFWGLRGSPAVLSVCDAAKIFFTSKFSLCTLLQPHQKN